jgi:hypothetical protein
MTLHVQQGFKCIFLWGFESWYEERTKYNISTIWEAVKSHSKTFLGLQASKFHYFTSELDPHLVLHVNGKKKEHGAHILISKRISEEHQVNNNNELI